jgi:hypothetical protein
VLVHELGLMEDGRRLLRQEFRDEGTPIEGLPVRRFSREGIEVPTVLRRLRQDPRLRHVRLGPNHVLWGEPGRFGCPGDGVRLAAAAEVPMARAGAGATVAVLDTGILDPPRTGQQALLERRVVGIAGGVDRADEDANGQLDWEAGHGTFVAGVVLQWACDATVLDVQVLDSDGIGDEAKVAEGIMRAIRTAEAHGGLDVLNLSLGCHTENDVEPPSIRDAVHAALQGGAVVVCAAGNWGGTPEAGRKVWPAAMTAKAVLSVAATSRGANGDGPINWGTYCPWSNTAKRDAEAPGHVVSFYLDEATAWLLESDPDVPAITFDTGWARWGGTSFAAPQVSGALAAAMNDGTGTIRTATEALAYLRASGTTPFGAAMGVRF